MKIAHIVCSFYPYRGGIGTVAGQFARQGVRLGNEVEILTPEYTTVNETGDFLFPVKRIKPLVKLGNAAFIPSILKQLKRFDILHLHYPFFGTHELLWFKSIFNSRAKLVVTYHMDFIPDSFIKKAFGLPSKYILPNLFKQANAITVSSFDYIKHSQVADLYHKYQSKFQQIPFGADETCYYQETQTDNKNKNILFVGGLDKSHYFKGLQNLIKVMPEIKANLIVVGKGDLMPYYQGLVEDLSLTDKVIFTGRVDNDKLRELYNSSTVLVLPSINIGEAFGIVSVNAYACKKPVIASDLPGVRTVVDHGETGFTVKPNDLSALTNAINVIVNDEYLAQKMGNVAYQKYLKQYNWDKIGEKLQKIYQSC